MPTTIMETRRGIDQQIELKHIEPGKPVQNAKVESFNCRLRDECLNVSWFANLWDARRKISAWREEYNHQRPHSSLGYLTPIEFHSFMLPRQHETQSRLRKPTCFSNTLRSYDEVGGFWRQVTGF